MLRERVDHLAEPSSIFMKLLRNCSGKDSRAITEKSVVALCFAWWALQPSDAVAPRRSEILGGQSADLSQETAGQVLEFRAGLLVWLDRVNASGGVAGLPIVLRLLDDARRLERVVANRGHLGFHRIADEVPPCSGGWPLASLPG